LTIHGGGLFCGRDGFPLALFSEGEGLTVGVVRIENLTAPFDDPLDRLVFDALYQMETWGIMEC
jgi:hypothetical protein